MRKIPVLSRFVAAVFVVGLLAAGCSDADGRPTPTAQPTVSEEPSEAPSSSEPTSRAPGPPPWPEPTRPAAMEREDTEGAKAAAEYFLKLYPYVYVTGDLAAWREISHPDCQFCVGVIENVGTLHSDGGYADGPRIEFVETRAAAPEDADGYFAVAIEAVEHPSSRYNALGDVVASLKGSRIDAELALGVTDGDWRIRGAVVTPRGDDGK